jgi:hypothetical protein
LVILLFQQSITGPDCEVPAVFRSPCKHPLPVLGVVSCWVVENCWNSYVVTFWLAKSPYYSVHKKRQAASQEWNGGEIMLMI